MTSRCHHAQFAQCWDGTQGFGNARQTFTTVSQPKMKLSIAPI